ncbi:MAG TPA: TetR family transcriptional regulator [Solirubrobacteraceae bacterium]|nr:TetR family transcriptional regulator [Solirubrobacteraceae bacterium]
MDEKTNDNSEDVDEAAHESLIDGLIGEEMGDTMASVMRRVRRAQEQWYRAEHPDEGLRDRKRRLTRQLISDAATALFASRGFDEVKVSEVARRVGVSEKTIYNYFPTKESMVLDSADEMVEGIAAALRERGPDESITAAVVRALAGETERFDFDIDGLAETVPAFVAMIEQTPALHAAWLEIHARLAQVVTEELAQEAGVDPRDPEPMIAGRALVGLGEVGMQSRVRHTQDGLRGDELREAVLSDVQRAARLLDTGLWAFNLPASRRARTQAAEAARAAEVARRQVVVALREARAAWDQARTAAHEAGEEVRRAGQEARREMQAEQRERRRQAAEQRRAERRER